MLAGAFLSLILLSGICEVLFFGWGRSADFRKKDEFCAQNLVLVSFFLNFAFRKAESAFACHL